ncbi:hypothetical protein HYQ45_007302 [Verticillium longisporum]|uniref:Uncharacterized protein n=1 Tax=Verticillium longisporum TaxID=100787 RepID=A0A8I2ZNL1_VERLO|nr:hypothetical protein HYQ45_007302 [Verticillium longisporum]
MPPGAGIVQSPLRSLAVRCGNLGASTGYVQFDSFTFIVYLFYDCSAGSESTITSPIWIYGAACTLACLNTN